MSKDQSYDFGDLLIATSDRLATDPKDRIFALVGLASKDIRDALVTDYTKMTRVIFEQVIVSALRFKDQDLRAAAAVKLGPALKLHSWCLDFPNIGWL